MKNKLQPGNFMGVPTIYKPDKVVLQLEKKYIGAVLLCLGFMFACKL